MNTEDQIADARRIDANTETMLDTKAWRKLLRALLAEIDNQQRTPDGYAVVRASGAFVGVYAQHETARKVCDRERGGDEIVRPMIFINVGFVRNDGTTAPIRGSGSDRRTDPEDDGISMHRVERVNERKADRRQKPL